MAGDPTKTSMWTDADVYVAPLGTELPDSVNEPFPSAWGLVGLLDGDAGFEASREWDTGDHFAWGGTHIRTHYRNYKETKSFTALEDNEVTRKLLWPGSENGVLVIPRPIRQLIAFEVRDPELNKIRRMIAAFQVDIVAENPGNEAEAELTQYEYVATIYPGPDKELWVEQDGLLVPEAGGTGD